MYILCFQHFFQLPVRRSPPSSSRGVGGRCPDPGFRASAGYWRASALASPHHPDCYSSAPGWRSHDHETTRTWTGAVTENGWMDEWILLKVNRNFFFLRFQYLYNACQVSDWSQSWINCHHVFVIAKKCWYCALLLLGANCESGLTRNHVTKWITGSQIAADETTDQSD